VVCESIDGDDRIVGDNDVELDEDEGGVGGARFSFCNSFK
jgi:hypothetical protein